jgi:hypothetical protein
MSKIRLAGQGYYEKIKKKRVCLPIVSNRSNRLGRSLEVLAVTKFNFDRSSLDSVHLSSNS